MPHFDAMEAGIVAAILAPISALVSRVTFTARPMKTLRTLDAMMATYRSMSEEPDLTDARTSLASAIKVKSAELVPTGRSGRVAGSHEPATVVLGVILAGLTAWGGWAVYTLHRGWTGWVGVFLWIFAATFLWSALDVYFRGPVKNRPPKP